MISFFFSSFFLLFCSTFSFSFLSFVLFLSLFFLFCFLFLSLLVSVFNQLQSNQDSDELYPFVTNLSGGQIALMAHPTLPLFVEALLDSQPTTSRRLRKKKLQQVDFTFSNLTVLQAATSSFTFPSSPSASGFGGGISVGGGGFHFPNLVTPPSSPPLSCDDDF